MLETAALAPSVHNAQPWAFRTAPDVVELYADATRRMPVADPDDQELRLGCGAALFNLRLALLVRGVRPDVALFPDPARRHLVAQVRRAGTARATPELSACSTPCPAATPTAARSPTPRSPAPSATHCAGPPPTRGRCCTSCRPPCGPRSAGSRSRRTAASWPIRRSARSCSTGPGPGPTGPDGVPARAAGPAPAPHDRWVVRDFTGGTARERAPGRDVEEEPLLALLIPHVTGPAADVRAGEAMQRVLLTATTEGLAVSFLSHLVEVPEVRDELRTLVGAARPPVAVLRIGRGWPTTRTPRRPLADLIRP